MLPVSGWRKGAQTQEAGGQGWTCACTSSHMMLGPPWPHRGDVSPGVAPGPVPGAPHASWKGDCRAGKLSRACPGPPGAPSSPACGCLSPDRWGGLLEASTAFQVPCIWGPSPHCQREEAKLRVRDGVCCQDQKGPSAGPSSTAHQLSDLSGFRLPIGKTGSPGTAQCS